MKGFQMPFNEADTRAKLIDPAIHKRGWTEDLICREETAGAIEILDGKARRRARGKVDYVLRLKVNPTDQPVAIGLLEAKREELPPSHGLEQAKCYAACKRLAEVDFPIAKVSKHSALKKSISEAGAGGLERVGRLPIRRGRLTVAIGIKSDREVVP